MTNLTTVKPSRTRNIRHKTGCDCPSCSERKQREILYDPEERKKKLRRDRRKRIISTTKFPFRFICNIEIVKKSTGTPIIRATGTLIGPRTVLTAAHNLWDSSTNRKYDLSKFEIRIIPGRNGAKKPLPASLASKLIPYPGYNSSLEGRARDFAIIHLKHPIGNKVGYWSYSFSRQSGDKNGTSILKGGLPYHPASGRLKANLCGYPVDKPSSCTVHTCGTMQYWTYNKIVLLKDGILHYYHDTFGGMSGSPVWIKRSRWTGGRVLVGIHVARDFGEDRIIANRAVFVGSRVRKFITSNLK